MGFIDVCKLIVCAVLGYFLGNLQTAILLSRSLFNDDVRGHGSGNAGATNMLRVFGLRAGIVTFVGDFLKGILAVLLGRLIGGVYGGYWAGLFVVVGHDFPLLFWMRGGKGVASSVGVAFMVAPVLAAISLTVAIVLILITKIVAVGSLVGYTLLTILVFVLHWGNVPLLILTGALWLLLLLRHKENIVRICRGGENRIHERASGKRDPPSPK